MYVAPGSVPLITCDTNVLVSGTLVESGPPGQVVKAWRDDRLELALSKAILKEIADVFNRPYFQAHGWTTEKTRRYITELAASSVVVPGTTLVNVSPDPDDNQIFACALEAEVDYIVSGDKKHVLPVGAFEGIPVVSPREFLSTLKLVQKAA